MISDLMGESSFVANSDDDDNNNSNSTTLISQGCFLFRLSGRAMSMTMLDEEMILHASLACTLVHLQEA